MSAEEQWLIDQLREALLWGDRVANELLGHGVRIQMTRWGLGHTFDPAGGVPAIRVNPYVLTEPRGPELIRALILHEIGHHWAHFPQPDWDDVDNAMDRSHRPLFNLLLDEQMERALRSYNAQWGEMLDALVSYAFASPRTIDVEYYYMQFPPPREPRQADAFQAALEMDLLNGNGPGRVASYRREWRWGPAREIISRSDVEELVLGEIRKRAGQEWPDGPHDAFGVILITAESAADAIDALAKREEFPSGISMEEARINLAHFLDPDQDELEAPEDYVARVETAARTYGRAFPGLRHLANELTGALGSKWFWERARSMLSQLRKTGAVQLDEVPTELRLEPHADPLAVVEHLFNELELEMDELLDQPKTVEVDWTRVVSGSWHNPTDSFATALRMGCSLDRAPAHNRGRRALERIPTDLRHRPPSDIQSLTLQLWEILKDPDSPLGELEIYTTLRALESTRKGEGVGPEDGDGDSSAPHARVDTGEPGSWVEQAVDQAATERKRRIGGKPRAVSSGKAVRPGVGGGGGGWNAEDESSFEPIERVVVPPEDPEGYRELLKQVRPHVRALRRHLASLGVQAVEEEASRYGKRLDLARARLLPVVPRPEILRSRSEVPGGHTFIAVAIDCSGSMTERVEHYSRSRMNVAATFGALILEAARQLQTVAVRAFGFTHDVVYDAGRSGNTRIASLEASGGNNDAAAVHHGWQLAKSHSAATKVFVMISDGLPTESSLSALRTEVNRVAEDGVSCAQVAVAPIAEEQAAFPDFTDLSSMSFEQAVRDFGRLLMRLTTETTSRPARR